MARLDGLAMARDVAQLCAVLGREFSYEMIRAVSSMEETTLEQALGQLVQAEVVYRRGLQPQASYVFKHALIRDAAYQSLLKSRRRTYHDRIAHVLEERFPETREAQPELLAHHYTEAGITAQAIAYWQRAGQRAIERSANLEAIAYLTQGLQLIPMLPEGTQRTQNELALQVALGVPLLATKGYAAIEVERAYARARELSVQVEDSPQMPTILWGLWVFYPTRGPLEMALQIAEQYRVFAERQQLTPLLLETCQLVGNALFYLGEFVQALPYLQQGSRLYDPTQHHALIFEHGGADTGVAITTHHALTLWVLGYPDRARETMDASIRCARMLAHPFSLAFAHYFSAWLYKLCREESAVHESTTSAISICDEHGFPFWGLSSVALRGSTLVEQGAEEAGVTVMREALAAFGATGARALSLGATGFAGRSAWPDRTADGRLGSNFGRLYGDGKKSGTLVACRTAPRSGRAPERSARRSYERGGERSSGSGGCSSPPAGSIMGAAGGHEPQPPLAAAGKGQGCSRLSRRHLSLVHGRPRDRRSPTSAFPAYGSSRSCPPVMSSTARCSRRDEKDIAPRNR